MKVWLVVLVILLSTVCGAHAQATPSYSVYYKVEELAVLPEGGGSEAMHINNKGVVSGSVNDADNTYACLWRDNSITLLDSGLARSVNNLGVACGESHFFGRGSIIFIDTSPMACVWGGEEPVFLSSSPYSTANAINDHGSIAGLDMIYTGNGVTTAMPTVWIDQQEQLLSLSEGYCTDINNRGQVVGTTYQDKVCATIWSPGQQEKILGPGYASAINEWGQVVGYTFLMGKSQACSWTAGKDSVKFEYLGSLGGESWANGNNLLGQAVGMAVNLSGQYRAVIYLRGGKVLDLNDRVLFPNREWQLNCAFSINDRGQIAARGNNRLTGESRAFLLSPVSVWR